jgi:hypothetical protein
VEELGDEKREGGVAKKILMVLSLLGLVSAGGSN